MTDLNEIPASPLEELMREALASVRPPENLRGEILAAVKAERKRARRLALYRRAGVIAAAVLILVPAVTLPIFRTTRDALPKTETLSAGMKDAVSVSTLGSAAPVESAETTAQTLVLFSTSAPMFAASPAGTAPAAREEKAPQAPADAAEPAYFAVLREKVGADALALWLAAYEGDPASPEAEAAAYAYFGLDD